MEHKEAYDAVIAGGGLAGLSLALALRQGLGDGARLAVADPAFARNEAKSGDMHASAFAAGARRLASLAAEAVAVAAPVSLRAAWPAAAVVACAVPPRESSNPLPLRSSRKPDGMAAAILSFWLESRPEMPFALMSPLLCWARPPSTIGVRTPSRELPAP